MTATVETVNVTEPGVYDLSADAYHRDPTPDGSLSVSGARLLLPPSCPARYAWQRSHPQAPSAVFDIGHAAHTLALGDGPDLMLIDVKDWRTKAAQVQVEEARANGFIPLKRGDYEAVHAMVAALKDHPKASLLFGYGQVEKSLFWVDEDTGIMCRARPDWMPVNPVGRMIVVDYKTTQSASPQLLPNHLNDYGYHQQAAWYLDGVRALSLADDAAFVFVFQEKTPPYLITVAEPDALALSVGTDRNRRARQIYRDCADAGVWPGYSEEIELMSLPPWALRRHHEETW